MIIHRNPADHPPPPTYNQGVEVSGPVRTLYVSGQIAVRPDGTVPDGITEQAELVFANMAAVLSESGMGFGDIVKTTVFLIRPADRAGFSDVRAKVFGAAKPASTLVYVAGLARPELLVEVEAVAVADA